MSIWFEWKPLYYGSFGWVNKKSAQSGGLVWCIKNNNMLCIISKIIFCLSKYPSHSLALYTFRGKVSNHIYACFKNSCIANTMVCYVLVIIYT